MIRAEIDNPLNVDGQEYPVERAKSVLWRAILTHEKTITITHPFDRIGEFSTQEIREAALVVFNNLVETNPWDLAYKENPQSKSQSLEKRNQWNERRLSLSYEYYPKGNPYFTSPIEVDYPFNLFFRASHVRKFKPRESIGNAQLPLVDNIPDGEADGWVYSSQGNDPWDNTKHAFFIAGNDNLTVPQFKILWRGVRWMFANMLSWDSPTVFSFEQLDTLTDQRHIAEGLNPASLVGTTVTNRLNR